MVRKTKRKTVVGVITIGTIVVAMQLFFLVGAATGYFPEEFFRKTLIYFVLTLGVFGFGAVSTAAFERKLFATSVVKELPKLLLGAGITLAILLLIQLILKPEVLTLISAGLILPLYVVLFHAFIVAFDETLVFQVFFPNQFKSRGLNKLAIYILSSSLFALFHIWTAGLQVLLIIPYIPLGFLFLYARYKYGWVFASGIHWAWNIFILGIIPLIS